MTTAIDSETSLLFRIARLKVELSIAERELRELGAKARESAKK